jgi:hypothetical protein
VEELRPSQITVGDWLTASLPYADGAAKKAWNRRKMFYGNDLHRFLDQRPG